MKFAFFAGGFAGFTLAAASGLIAGREPDLALRDACIACLIGAFVGRWFWGVWIRAIREMVEAKRAEAAAAAEAETAAQGAKPARR